MPYRTLALFDDVEAVREYAPSRRTITIGNGKVFSLQMPYIIFLKIDSDGRLHVAFSTKPIKSLNDTVYCATLGNVYPHWNVCGCSANNIEEGIIRFWNYRFTMEGQSGPYALSKVFGSYRKWATIESVKKVFTKIKTNSVDWKTFKEFLNSPWADEWNVLDPISKKYKLTMKTKYPRNDSIGKLTKRRKKQETTNEANEADEDNEVYAPIDWYDDGW